MSLLERVVVPVADERDAVATVTALSRHLDDVQSVVAVHVIEKGGGVADKAPMAKRKADAAEILAAVESRLGDAVTVETRVAFGTNVADTIVETALDADATAIAFCPRGGNRLVRFLSGDTAARLVSAPALPVVSLTAGRDTRSPPDARTRESDTEVSE
ncbi:universal stress protein [Halogeometricum sp. CBA1124]|nr:universal stress protein [Halogeometricum sp. CBA1124]MUV58574.1 universal stress protein [Halogeometricum sp. CBA1124]